MHAFVHEYTAEMEKKNATMFKSTSVSGAAYVNS